MVNLFTEDHAALTGARKTVIRNELKPERSYNVNLNYSKKVITGNGTIIGLDVAAWYTHFSNRIIGDYETNPNEIIYDNLKGYSVSKGITVNTDFSFLSGIKAMAGITLQDVSLNENGSRHNKYSQKKLPAPGLFLIKSNHGTSRLTIQVISMDLCDYPY